MSDPRFVCRREGHVPAVTMTLTKAAGVTVDEYAAKCSRCGQWATFPFGGFGAGGKTET